MPRLVAKASKLAATGLQRYPLGWVQAGDDSRVAGIAPVVQCDGNVVSNAPVHRDEYGALNVKPGQPEAA